MDTDAPYSPHIAQPVILASSLVLFGAVTPLTVVGGPVAGALLVAIAAWLALALPLSALLLFWLAQPQERLRRPIRGLGYFVLAGAMVVVKAGDALANVSLFALAAVVAGGMAGGMVAEGMRPRPEAPR